MLTRSLTHARASHAIPAFLIALTSFAASCKSTQRPPEVRVAKHDPPELSEALPLSAGPPAPARQLSKEATCALRVERDEPIAVQSVAGAWTPTMTVSGDVLWLTWLGYGEKLPDPREPQLFARAFSLASGDPLGDELHVGGRSGNALAGAGVVRVRENGQMERAAIDARGPLGPFIPIGAANRTVPPALVSGTAGGGLFWSSNRPDFPRLFFRALGAAPHVPSTRISSADDNFLRHRAIAVPNGYLVAWTEQSEAVWFASMAVEASGNARVAWRGAVPFPTGECIGNTCPAIEEMELGELARVGDEAWLPVLKHTIDGSMPETHVVRVSLSGQRRAELVLPAAPFFAATIGSFGPTLVAVADDAVDQLCVRRFGFQGQELVPPACFVSSAFPDVPRANVAYTSPTLMHATALWADDVLYVASLDLVNGVDQPFLRRFRCVEADPARSVSVIFRE